MGIYFNTSGKEENRCCKITGFKTKSGRKSISYCLYSSSYSLPGEHDTKVDRQVINIKVLIILASTRAGQRGLK